MYPIIREKGTVCCGNSRCETCSSIKRTDTFESFLTKKVYQINRSFDCDRKCLIYLISCKVCSGFTLHEKHSQNAPDFILICLNYFLQKVNKQ